MSGKNKLSRRTFLKQGAGAIAGAVAFPYIIPGSALGLDGTVAPSNRIVMASIGVGGQGTYDTKALMSIPEVQYVAVCDVDSEHRERMRNDVKAYYADKTGDANWNGCDAYNDFREVLARDDIDAVMVAPPDHWHAVISVAAAKAGKDIYCEKPLANSIPEGRAVVNAVERYQRVLQTGTHERSRDNARYACELVRNGRIGKLQRIEVNMPVDNHGPIGVEPPMPVPAALDYDLWLGPAPSAPYTAKRCHFYFRYILDYSGGEMTDRGAHIIDLAQFGNRSDYGGPVSVQGTGWFPKDGLFNTAMAYEFEFEYASGVVLHGKSVGPRGLKFIGEDGWIFIHIHGGDLEASDAWILKEQLLPSEQHLGRARSHHQNFIDCVKNRSVPNAPAEVGHRTGSMCHLGNIAMLLGRKLKWNPDTEQFINDDEANRMLVRSMRAPWRI